MNKSFSKPRPKFLVRIHEREEEEKAAKAREAAEKDRVALLVLELAAVALKAMSVSAPAHRSYVIRQKKRERGFFDRVEDWFFG